MEREWNDFRERKPDKVGFYEVRSWFEYDRYKNGEVYKLYWDGRLWRHGFAEFVDFWR